MIDAIFHFNKALLGIDRVEISPLSPGEEIWLRRALREEIKEYESSQTVEEKVDALLDLVYFAIGGLCRLGLTEAEAQASFDAIHRANLTKKRGVKASRPQDGSVADATKPYGFQDPVLVIRRILDRGNGDD